MGEWVSPRSSRLFNGQLGRADVLRIQRALLVELVFTAVIVTIVVTSAVFLSISLRFVSGGGGALGASVLAGLLPKMIPLSLIYSVPFAWLAATAIVMGRWVADHEVVALKTSGMPPRVLAVPVLALSGLLAVAGMVYNGFHVPRATRALNVGMSDYLPQFLSSLKGADRSIAFNAGRLSWDHWDAGEQRFVAVELDRRERDGRLSAMVIGKDLRLERISEGDKGEGLKLELEDAFLIRVPDGDPQVAFGGQRPIAMGRVQRVGASTLFNEFFGGARFVPHPRHMTLPELFYAREGPGVARGSMIDVDVAIHGRLALGSASFFLALFAMAMMLQLQPSNRRIRNFMLCFAPAVAIFFPLQTAGPTFARSGAIPPWLAMWLPNLVLVVISCLLFVRGARR